MNMTIEQLIDAIPYSARPLGAIDEIYYGPLKEELRAELAALQARADLVPGLVEALEDALKLALLTDAEARKLWDDKLSFRMRMKKNEATLSEARRVMEDEDE